MNWNSGSSAKSEAFRDLLLVISQRMRKENFNDLKFQSRDYIGAGTLEKINNTLDLFTVLEERDIVCEDDVDFLQRCLSNIFRKDLAKLVGQYVMTWMVPSPSSISYQESKMVPVKLGQQALSKQFVEHIPKHFGKNEALPFNASGTMQDDAFQARNLRHLSPTEMNLIRFMSDNLSYNWQATIRHLGVTDITIDAACFNWPNDVRRQISECLNYWIRYGGVLTRDDAIRATRLTGRNDLAQELTRFPS